MVAIAEAFGSHRPMSTGGWLGLLLGVDEIELRPGTARAGELREHRVLGSVLSGRPGHTGVDVPALLALLGDGHDGSSICNSDTSIVGHRGLRTPRLGDASHYSRLTLPVRYHCVRCRPPSRPKIRGSWRCPPPRSVAVSSSS